MWTNEFERLTALPTVDELKVAQYDFYRFFQATRSSDFTLSHQKQALLWPYVSPLVQWHSDC